MRKPVVLAALAAAAMLCGAVLTCTRKDTGFVKAWPRTVEPWLTGAEFEPCADVECGRAENAEMHCDEFGDSYAETLKMLASSPDCTDHAIEALEKHEPRARSDLAAAYYLRSFRQDRPSDLLRAFQYATKAVSDSPENVAARFNAALIQEKLGLWREANASWLAVALHDDSGWAREASTHVHGLRVRDAATEWPRQKARLLAALKAGDRAAVRDVVADYPDAALEYFEAAELSPAAARLLASELSARLGNDEYLSQADPAIGKEIRRAEDMVGEGTAHPLRILEALAPTAGHSSHLLARIQSARAYALSVQSRFLESLSDYEASLDIFTRLRDMEKVDSLHRSIGSVYREMGQPELSLYHCLQAVRNLRRTVTYRRRTGALTEIAETVVALGFPDVALLYQNEAVRQATLGHETREDAIRGPYVLASAYRARAGIEVILGKTADAQRDLDEAIRLPPTPNELRDALYQKALSVRRHEAFGDHLLKLGNARAADEFTSALNAIPPGQLITLRASLLTSRAEAYQQSGRTTEAEQDLAAALRVLREEELRMLEGGSREKGEAHWRAYFLRFEETYDRLIRLRFERDHAEGFNVDERSRGYEPLNRILRSDVAPREFRALVRNGEPMDLHAIRDNLRAGVVLLQYAVLEDRTYVWIVRREGSQGMELKARRSDVERWAGQINQATRRPHNATLFHEAGTAAFNALLREPLARAGNFDRIVIIPDGAMHGLPFAALRDDGGRYLMQHVTLEMAGSATLHVFSTMRDAAIPHTAQSALLIGDPRFRRSLPIAHGLAYLQGARDEVQFLRKIYEPRIPVATLLEQEATVENFFRLAPDRALIHIAAHALANPREPSRSMILLAWSKEHDGALTAEELVNRLKLDRTRIVVLAACRSAGGQPIGSEGVAPLVRPLITAGVPAVVGTLWDVDDATAGILSVSFHGFYEQGHDAAKALQAAQQHMLSKSSLPQSVFAWAPFQVVGHASSLFESH